MSLEEKKLNLSTRVNREAKEEALDTGTLTEWAILNARRRYSQSPLDKRLLNFFEHISVLLYPFLMMNAIFVIIISNLNHFTQ